MWIPLGELVPQFDLWMPFPNGIDAGGATVFRAQFISDGNLENVFSFLYFRRVWRFGTFREKEVEPSQRLYPQIHSLILHLPIPLALEYEGLAPVGYECKLERRFRKGNYAEPGFYVSLDAFVGENLPSYLNLEQQKKELQKISDELTILLQNGLQLS